VTGSNNGGGSDDTFSGSVDNNTGAFSAVGAKLGTVWIGTITRNENNLSGSGTWNWVASFGTCSGTWSGSGSAILQ
jgi:hypothetical protein